MSHTSPPLAPILHPPALVSRPAAPQPEGALAFLATAPPRANATLVQEEAALTPCPLYPDKAFKPFCRITSRYISTRLCHCQIAKLFHVFPSTSYHPGSSLSKMVASALPACVLSGVSGRLQQVPLSAFRPLCARIHTRAMMAGRQHGWSRAALLQLLLGVNLMVMPITQARSLRFVTLVMGDSHQRVCQN